MILTPSGPPDDPDAMLCGDLATDNLVLAITAIAVEPHGDTLIAHPNHRQIVNDLYLLRPPKATYRQNGRSYIVFGLTA